MQGAVELAVAAAVEPVTSLLARAGLERGDAGVAGEPGVASEALDRADLAEQLGGAERAAARKLEQPRGERLRPRLQLAARARRSRAWRRGNGRELRAIRTWVVCSAAGQPAAEPLEPEARSSAPSGTTRSGRVRAGASAGAAGAAPLGDQVVAVVEQQLQLAQAPLAGTRPVEARLARAARAIASASARPTCRVSGPPSLRRRQLGGTRTSGLADAEQQPLQPR